MAEIIIRAGTSHLRIRGGSLTTVPAAPSGLSATAVSTTQVDLVWVGNGPGVTSFVIGRSADGSTGWAVVGTTPAGTTSFSDTGLTASTAYYYRVQAVNASGGSAYSAVAGATTPAAGLPVIPAPTALAVSPAGPDRVTYTMTTAGGIAYNYAQLWASPTGANTYTQVGGNTLYYGTITAIGLLPATTYDFKARVNGSGSYVFSPFSAPVTGVTTAAAPSSTPAAPTGLTATARSDSRVDLAWTNNDPTAAAYAIDRSPDGTTWSVVTGSLPNTATSYIDTGLSQSTTYYYRARATNFAGSSAPTNTAHDTTIATPVVPAVPSNLVVSALSPSSARVAFADNTGGTAVHIVERLDDGITPHEVARLAPGVTSYTDSDPFLFPGGTYSYQVRSYGPGGLSDPHPHPGATHYGNSVDSTPAPAEGRVTLPAASPSSAPSVPTKAAAYPASDTKAWVAWNVNDFEKAETGFTIQLSTDGGTTWTTARASVPARWTGCYVSGLAASTAYRFRVASVNSFGASAYSAATNAVTSFPAGQNCSPTGRIPKFGHDPEWQAGVAAGLADFLAHEGYASYAAWKAAGYPIPDFATPYRGPASWGGQMVGKLLHDALLTGTPGEPYLQAPFRAAIAYQITGDTHFLDLAYAYWTTGNAADYIPPWFGRTGTVTGPATVTTVTRTDLELSYDHSVRSVSQPFTAADVGKVLMITGGAGWSTGRCEIATAPDASGYVYIRRSPGNALTGGVGTVTTTAFTANGLAGIDATGGGYGVKVWWDTGANVDLALQGQYRILTFDGPSSTVTVVPGMPAAVQVGDQFSCFDMGYWSGNTLRNFIEDLVHSVDMMWAGMTPAQRNRMINFMNALADNELGHGTFNALTGMADSLDQSFGVFGVFMISQTADMGNPRALSFLSDAVDPNAVNGGWPVGGLTPTALDRSTARNQVYSFCKGSVSGEWAYSSQYNPLDAALWGVGMLAMRTATDQEYFPEIAEWLPYFSANYHLAFSADNREYSSWGDDQAPDTLPLYSFVNLFGFYAGAVQRFSAWGPYMVNRLHKFWTDAGGASDPGANGAAADTQCYATVDFRDTGVDYTTGPNTYLGRGAHGVVHWHQNLADPTAAWFRSYMFTPSMFNHEVDWLNNFEVRFRQVRALTHPHEYDDYVHQENAVNGILLSNLDTPSECKGLIKQEFGPSGEYGYQVGSGYGWRANSFSLADVFQPGRAVHERTRSVVFLPSAAGNCVTVITHDRTHAQRADLTGNSAAYANFGLGNPQRLAAMTALEQGVFHFGNTPTVTGNRVAWTVPPGDSYASGQAARAAAGASYVPGTPALSEPGPGGFPANLDTLLPVGYVRTIGLPYPDANWTTPTQANPVSLHSFIYDNSTYELKYRALVTPNPPLPVNNASRFNTFLNVWQVYDPGVTTANTLVRSSSGEAVDGVLCTCTGEPDKLWFFGARMLDRVTRSGFTATWGSVAATTRVYVTDLDPAKTWRYTLDGGASTPLTQTGSNVGRVAVSGAGSHTLVLAGS